MTRVLATTVMVGVVSILLGASAAGACAVCYGDVDSPMTQGMNNGILVLLGVILAVQCGFVILFLSIRRRAQQQRRQREGFRFIQGGVG